MKRNPLKLSFMEIIKRGHYFYYIYFWIYSRITDHRIAGLSLNTTVHNNSNSFYPAQCISYFYIKELIPHLNIKEDDIFVDVGCAWGRLLGYLSKYITKNKLIGIELNQNVACFAKKALKKYNNIEIIYGDILHNIPPDGTIFYLFNPFDAKTMDLFLRELEIKIHHPVQLIYLHPTCRDVIEKHDANYKLILETHLKPKHMGELTLCIYKFMPKKP